MNPAKCSAKELHASMDLGGIDELRKALALFSGCRESFNERFTTTELLRIYRAWKRCEWLFYPDDWTREQVDAAATRGEVPRFNDRGHPLPPQNARERTPVDSMCATIAGSLDLAESASRILSDEHEIAREARRALGALAALARRAMR